MRQLTFNTYLNNLQSGNEPGLSLILAELSQLVRYRKNDTIYQKGKIPEHLAYIETGNAIALSQSKPPRQVLRFWMEKQLICPCGFFSNTPSSQRIVALDDCVMSCISYRQLFKFLHDFPYAYKIVNTILQSEINLVELNIKSLTQNSTLQSHEALLNALALSVDD